MKLNEIAAATKRGTYAAMQLSNDTKKRINAFVKKHKIPNASRKDTYHTTIAYSTKFAPEYESLGELENEWKGKPDKLKVFKTGGKGTDALVLLINCPELNNRHEEVHEKYGLHYDFPNYHPHITLSYNIGDFDYGKISKEDIEAIGDIIYSGEYVEDLDLDWASDK